MDTSDPENKQVLIERMKQLVHRVRTENMNAIKAGTVAASIVTENLNGVGPAHHDHDILNGAGNLEVSMDGDDMIEDEEEVQVKMNSKDMMAAAAAASSNNRDN